jgi:adenylosuccinate lyase
VIPRDHYAKIISTGSLIGSLLERMATEFRLLQHSDIDEVHEGFSKGQKGSSTMPHKKNPISAENITGAARILRSYVVAAMENVALWHERDISHSSVERVMFPDVFILADYAVYRMTQLVEGLDVNAERMKENIESSQGQLYSSLVLLALVQKGLSREEAYAHVQRLSHSLQRGEHLREKLETDSVVKKLLNKKDLEDIFSGKRHREMIQSLQRSLKTRLETSF